MTITADQIADECLQFIVNRCNITLGTRLAIRNYITQKVEPLAPRAQSALKFEGDKEGLEGQSLAILKLLKERRAAGACNYELAELSLKYTSRVSDLRKAGWKITCERQEGRTTVYKLAATDW